MPQPSASAERRVRASFERQGLMATLGASITSVENGAVEIRLQPRDELGQQHGYLHAGVVIAVIDSACGYAALSLVDAPDEVLTVELKANLLAPAGGGELRARGRVLRAGRTLTVCQGDAFIAVPDGERHVATALVTIIRATPRP
jgi:uncharacterized protein (TIGR00369 family)